MEVGQKYKYNYDMSLGWMFPPGPLVREVIDVFEHEKHGHVVKVEVRKHGQRNNRWVRHEEFTKELQDGKWSLIE